jgi:hypothetical protein
VCLFKKTHLHLENQQSACFKTDFNASHFLQVILSVASLLLEITFSKFSRNKMVINSGVESKLTKKFTFTYTSKCTDFNNAMKQLQFFRINLINEVKLKILFLKLRCDNHVKMSILFVFELNNPEVLDKIVQQFDVFTAYLDTLSRM